SFWAHWPSSTPLATCSTFAPGKSSPARDDRTAASPPAAQLYGNSFRPTPACGDTNVELTKTPLTKLAMMANCGAARAIRPYHTTGDGDQLFAVSTRKLKRDDINVTMVGTLAAEVAADAILRGVTTATSVEG